jgi:hypothetical protein
MGYACPTAVVSSSAYFDGACVVEAWQWQRDECNEENPRARRGPRGARYPVLAASSARPCVTAGRGNGWAARTHRQGPPDRGKARPIIGAGQSFLGVVVCASAKR